MIKQRTKIPSQIEQFFDNVFQDSKNLHRVARWLDILTWLVLINLAAILIGSFLRLFNLLNLFPLGDHRIGETLAPMSPLDIIGELENLGFSVFQHLRTIAFFLASILLLRMLKHALHLVFDITKATRPKQSTASE